MSNNVVSKPDKDFKGQHLCTPCFNGRHYGKDYLGRRVLNCELQHTEGGPCECHCVAVANEIHPKKRSDKSAQTLIDTGDDVIVIR